jgi:hypothetical protein
VTSGTRVTIVTCVTFVTCVACLTVTQGLCDLSDMCDLCDLCDLPLQVARYKGSPSPSVSSPVPPQRMCAPACPNTLMSLPSSAATPSTVPTMSCSSEPWRHPMWARPRSVWCTPPAALHRWGPQDQYFGKVTLQQYFAAVLCSSSSQQYF